MRFQHTPIDNLDRYDGLDCEYSTGKRRYIVEHDGQMEYYPSVTTILSNDPEKQKSLAAWRKRIGVEEAERISKRAAGRGEILHKICEDYLNNKEEYLSTRHDANAMFFDIKGKLDDNVNEVVSQEVALVSHTLRIAGRVDLIAKWDGDYAIIDFKQSNRPKRLEWIQDYFKQISAYTAMVYEMTDILIKRGIVLIAVDGSEPQMFEFNPWDHIKSLCDDIKRYEDMVA